MVQPHIKRELSLYGGVVSAVLVAVVLGASYATTFPFRYTLVPLLIVTLFVGGILAGASDSGPGLVGEGNVSGEGGEVESVRGDFTPGDSSTGVVPAIRSRPVVFTLFGVAFWSFLGLVVTAVLG